MPISSFVKDIIIAVLLFLLIYFSGSFGFIKALITAVLLTIWISVFNVIMTKWNSKWVYLVKLVHFTFIFFIAGYFLSPSFSFLGALFSGVCLALLLLLADLSAAVRKEKLEVWL